MCLLPTANCPCILTSTLPCLSSFRSSCSHAETEGPAVTDRVRSRSQAAAAQHQCFVLILFGVWALWPGGHQHHWQLLYTVNTSVQPEGALWVLLLDQEGHLFALCSHCRVIMLYYHTILGLPKGPAKTSPQVIHTRVFWNIQIQYYCSQLAYRPFQQHHQTRDCHLCPAIIQRWQRTISSHPITVK